MECLRDERIVAFALSMGLTFGQAHAQRHYEPEQFGAASPSAPTAEAKPVYLFDLQQKFPAVFDLWQKSIPRSVDWPNWLSKFDGVSGPLRDVAVGGKSMKFATVCMPHDCGDNIAGVLFSSTRIVAVVHMTGTNQTPTLMVVGQMSGPEFACMQTLIGDLNKSVAVCP